MFGSKKPKASETKAPETGISFGALAGRVDPYAMAMNDRWMLPPEPRHNLGSVDSLTVSEPSSGQTADERQYLRHLQSAMNMNKYLKPMITDHLHTGPKIKSYIHDPKWRMSSLKMRLRVPPEEEVFQAFETFLVNETVYVFIVSNNQSVTLEDQISLFPSDTLMSQIGLLR